MDYTNRSTVSVSTFVNTPRARTSEIAHKTRGYVYLARSEAMREGVLKVGLTENTPNERMQQLSAQTAAAMPFHVLYSRVVPDCAKTEADMHRLLAEFRVNDRREFFEVPLADAARILDHLADDALGLHKPATPFADLFARFPDDGSPRSLTAAEREQCRALEARERECEQDKFAAECAQEEGWIARSLRRIARRKSEMILEPYGL
jgi:hypothetical protein